MIQISQIHDSWFLTYNPITFSSSPVGPPTHGPPDPQLTCLVSQSSPKHRKLLIVGGNMDAVFGLKYCFGPARLIVFITHQGSLQRKHRKNCKCCPVSQLIVRYYKDCHETRFSIVRIVISVSNVTSLQDCLFNRQNWKGNCLICENCCQLLKQ